MFSFGKKDEGKKKNSFTDNLVNIATITSATLISLRLMIWHVVEVKTGAAIMLGVVVFVAIGNNLSKIVLACIAVLLFVLYYSKGEKTALDNILTLVLTLLIIFSAIYFMLRNLFGKK